jgi:hypothetical protein
LSKSVSKSFMKFKEEGTKAAPVRKLLKPWQFQHLNVHVP